MFVSPRSVRCTSVLLLAAIGACAMRGGAAASTRVPLVQIDYRTREVPILPEERHLPADHAALAFGLPLLSTVTVEAGSRELRVSDWYGMVAGTAVVILRLVERPGQPPVGEWLWVWPERPEWRRPTRNARCTQWSDGGRYCAAGPVRGTTDWVSVAARLDGLGAWTLSQPCADDGVFVSDGGELLMQRLSGAAFSTYECNQPQRRRSSEAGRAAGAIYSLVDSLARTAGGPPPA